MTSRPLVRAAAAFLVVALTPTLAPSADAQAGYTRGREIPPVTMSYDDLFRIVTKVVVLVSDANRDSDSTSFTRCTFQVSGGGASVSFGRRHRDADLARAPSPATDVDFSYHRMDAPVSDVKINLSDYRREVSVGGSDPDRVEAILSAVTEDLQRHSSWVGGFPTRFAITILAAIFAMLLVWRFRHLSGWRVALVVLSALSIYILGLVTLAMSQWFPGAAVYRGDASFIIRNAPQISFAAAALAPILFFVSYLQANRLARRADGRDVQPEQVAPDDE